MSLFCCEHCGGMIIDTPDGYISECEHYPTLEQRIDSALDRILKASGSSLKNYTMHSTLKEMREAMKKIMISSYTQGSNDNFAAMIKASKSGFYGENQGPLRGPDGPVGPPGPQLRREKCDS